MVYIKVLRDAGCNIEHDSNECRVIYKDTTVWNGNREPYTGVWVIPLNPTIDTKISMDHIQSKPTTEVVSNAYSITS